MPDDLVLQRPYIRQMIEGFNIPIFEVPGIEADDVIGSMAKQFTYDGLEITIVTGDKDLLQLVEDGRIWGYDTMKDIKYQREEVHNKMGVYPERIIDLLALMGDSSDNIPGVRGIGPKTALKLLDTYKSLNGIYEHIDDVSGAVHQKLIADQELARISYHLATIKTDVPLHVTLDQLIMQAPDLEKLNLLCDELEFTSLKKDINQLGTFETSLYEAPKPVHEKKYRTIMNKKMFDHLIEEIKKKKSFSFDTETDSLDVLQAHLIGISLSCEPNIGYYVPLAHQDYKYNLDRPYVLEQIFSLIDDEQIAKYAHNMKFDTMMLDMERKRLKQPIENSQPSQESQMGLFE
jgi:DNA polymerase-1